MHLNGSRGADGSRGASEWEIVVATRSPEAVIRTLIVDHDPVSRRVVCGVLRGGERIEVVASIDSHREVVDWPLRQVDVVVMVAGHRDALFGAVREVTARPIRVLVVGIDWTRRDLDAAVSAGASGCLMKDTELKGLVDSVHAVAAGNMVLSPELLQMYIPVPLPGAAQRRRALDTVQKLSERELEILTLLGDGMSTTDAAKRCGVSNATIKSHVSHALTKLGARNRLEAVLMINGTVASPGWPGTLRSAAG